jgi:hypothetical protein
MWRYYQEYAILDFAKKKNVPFVYYVRVILCSTIIQKFLSRRVTVETVRVISGGKSSRRWEVQMGVMEVEGVVYTWKLQLI